jgi:hypothetical protein
MEVWCWRLAHVANEEKDFKIEHCAWEQKSAMVCVLSSKANDASENQDIFYDCCLHELSLWEAYLFSSWS